MAKSYTVDKLVASIVEACALDGLTVDTGKLTNAIAAHIGRVDVGSRTVRGKWIAPTKTNKLGATEQSVTMKGKAKQSGRNPLGLLVAWATMATDNAGGFGGQRLPVEGSEWIERVCLEETAE